MLDDRPRCRNDDAAGLSGKAQMVQAPPMGRSQPATDAAPWHEAGPSPGATKTERRALHLEMRDGVQIALDVHLPAEARRAGARLATILHQTRYHRGVDLRRPFRLAPVESFLDHPAGTRRRFLAAGYAWVDVCARGSGASTGRRPCPWSPDEIADGAEIVDWIVTQPWSDGLVGATGVSYDGTAAELLLVTEHPAVRAVAPRFSLFDVYTDVAFPGGIHLAWFTEQWGVFNLALDENRFHRAIAQMGRLQLRALAQRRFLPRAKWLDAALALADSDVVGAALAGLAFCVASGVRPVDADPARELLRVAIRDHLANFDVHQGALEVVHRDDRNVSAAFPDDCIDLFSPHTYRRSLAHRGVPIYSYSGWADGGYPHSAVKRFRTVSTPGSRLILGPWDHGGGCHISPYGPRGPAAFDHDGELLRFFDHHLRGRDTGIDAEPAVRYFTIGQERWKSAGEWPPPGAELRPWYLADDRRLDEARPDESGTDEYRVDRTVGTGHRSRWNALLGLLMPVDYPDRIEQGRRSLVYRSAPLSQPVEVTGHPIVTLHLASTERDATVFAYLEDERPDGSVDYVTEGQLRALHRRICDRPRPTSSPTPFHSFERADAKPLVPGERCELRFDLLPISWRFAVGHRIRLALAGADRDHFAQLPETPTLGIFRGKPHASRIELPVMPPPLSP